MTTGFCFGLIFALAGLLLLVVGVFNMLIEDVQSKKKRVWPSVMGQIVSTQVYESQSTSGFMPTVSYNVEFRYEYVVDGVTYSSTYFSYNQNFHGNTVAQVTASVETVYPAGTPVKLYYNPQDPKNIILEKGPGDAHKLLVYGLILLPLGLGLVCLLPQIN